MLTLLVTRADDIGSLIYLIQKIKLALQPEYDHMSMSLQCTDSETALNEPFSVSVSGQET